MSFISMLSEFGQPFPLTAVAKTRSTDPKMRMRASMIEGCERQINLIKSDRVSKSHPWFRTTSNDDGSMSYICQLRNGVRIIPLTETRVGLLMNHKDDALKFYSEAIAATHAGDLDDILKVTARKKGGV